MWDWVSNLEWANIVLAGIALVSMGVALGSRAQTNRSLELAADSLDLARDLAKDGQVVLSVSRLNLPKDMQIGLSEDIGGRDGLPYGLVLRNSGMRAAYDLSFEMDGFDMSPDCFSELGPQAQVTLLCSIHGDKVPDMSVIWHRQREDSTASERTHLGFPLSDR